MPAWKGREKERKKFCLQSSSSPSHVNNNDGETSQTAETKFFPIYQFKKILKSSFPQFFFSFEVVYVLNVVEERVKLLEHTEEDER